MASKQEIPTNEADMEHQDNLNSITDKDEIWKIEDVWREVENSEKDQKMKWYIEKESKDELNRIKGQCVNVIKAFDGTEEKKEEASQAILSLLRINQILWKVKISWWTPIDLKWNCFNQLVALVWTKWVDFKTVLWNDEWEIVIAACKKVEGLLNKPSEEDKKKIEIKDALRKQEKEIARITELSNKYNKLWVNAAFRKLRDDVNNNKQLKETFKSDVFWLVDICCSILKNQDNDLREDFYSNKIKAFQEFVKEKAKEWWVYANALKLLSEDGKIPLDKVSDWKLGRNTLKCLIKFVNDWLDFNPKPIEEKKWTAKFESKEGKKETWDVLDRMPTAFAAFKKYWELSDDKRWYKIFSFYDNPKKLDYVNTESWTWKQYVKIWGEKFYINLPSGEWENELQFKNKLVPREMYWDVIKTTDLCFGKFDGKWNLIDWTKVTIDSEWKQIWSLIMNDHEVKDAKWHFVWKLWLRTMWWSEGKVVDKNWERVTQDVKWRIDIFWEDWKDTKRLSDEQLDALMKDKEACKIVLDLAINAYTDTMHKPSEIWRYNLSHIIDRLLSWLDGEGKKQIIDSIHNEWCFDSWSNRKERVASFFNLEHWLFSNPENKVNKGDLDEDEMKKYMSLKTNAEKREYRSKLSQWNRIISRLNLLKSVLEWKKTEVVNPKLDNDEWAKKEDWASEPFVDSVVNPVDPAVDPLNWKLDLA